MNGSRPPRSGITTSSERSARPIEERAVAEVVRHLRTFEDEPSLGRVWSRVSRAVPGHESMMSRGRARRNAESGKRAAWSRVTAGVVLVAAGALMGVYLDRSFGRAPVYLAQSEGVPSNVGQLPAAQPVDQPVATEQAPMAAGRAPERRLAAQERSRSAGMSGSFSRQNSAGLLVASTPAPVASVSTDSAAAAPGHALGPNAAGMAEPAPVAPMAAWHGLAERGDFEGAAKALDSTGGFEQAFLMAGPDELMTLADVARAVGRPALAIQALRVVIDRYRDDENAPLAAMTLGNLLRRAGDAVGAAEAFALNRRLSPGGDFAEDALVREFDMAMEAMDLTEAERLRSQYEREYPEGRHSEVLRAELERLAAELLPPVGEEEEEAGSTPDESADVSAEQPSAPDDELHAPEGDGNSKSAETER